MNNRNGRSSKVLAMLEGTQSRRPPFRCLEGFQSALTNPWVRALELPDNVAGVCCYDTKVCNKNGTPVEGQAVREVLDRIAYPTMPMDAKTEGSDRIPSEIVSAIMIIEHCLRF